MATQPPTYAAAPTPPASLPPSPPASLPPPRPASGPPVQPAPARVVAPATPVPAQAAAPSPVPSTKGRRADTVEVRVLGPVEVRPAGEHRTELATLVALAALLPAGIPAELMNELLPQPGGVAAAASQLGAWLGVDPSGAPRLADQGGAWSLSADVRVDWHTFRELVSTPGAAGEERRLASALALIRGELCAGVAFPPVAQRVLQPVLAELQTVVVNAIRRDVERARSADDPARAEWALRQGLTLLPHEARLRRL